MRNSGVPIILMIVVSALSINKSLAESNAQASVGRRIYVIGLGSENITAFPGGGNKSFSATLFPCAGCHGSDGRGRAEAGWQVPDIRNEVLGAEADKKIVAALKGTKDQQRMPRYKLGSNDTAALFAYLSVVGTDDAPEPGLTAQYIYLAVFLSEDFSSCHDAGALPKTSAASAVTIYNRLLKLRFDGGTKDAAFAALSVGATEQQNVEDMPIIEVPLSGRPQDCATIDEVLVNSLQPVISTFNRIGRLATRQKFVSEFRKHNTLTIRGMQ
jgi:cytochrome c553